MISGGAGLGTSKHRKVPRKAHRTKRGVAPLPEKPHAPLACPAITPGPDMLEPLHHHALTPRVYDMQLAALFREFFADAMERTSGQRRAWR
jgi:hypothetical protein